MHDGGLSVYVYIYVHNVLSEASGRGRAGFARCAGTDCAILILQSYIRQVNSPDIQWIQAVEQCTGLR